MAALFYGKISSVNYQTGTANVTLPDRENQVIQGVPFLAMCCEMPSPGETVATLFEEVNGQIGKGVILGKLSLGAAGFEEGGPGIFYKAFSDGASIKYTPATGELECTTPKVVVEELIYKNLKQG